MSDAVSWQTVALRISDGATVVLSLAIFAFIFYMYVKFILDTKKEPSFLAQASWIILMFLIAVMAVHTGYLPSPRNIFTEREIQFFGLLLFVIVLAWIINVRSLEQFFSQTITLEEGYRLALHWLQEHDMDLYGDTGFIQNPLTKMTDQDMVIQGQTVHLGHYLFLVKYHGVCWLKVRRTKTFWRAPEVIFWDWDNPPWDEIAKVFYKSTSGGEPEPELTQWVKENLTPMHRMAKAEMAQEGAA